MVNSKIIFALFVLVSFSFAVPTFVSPTPANNSVYGDYDFIFNITDGGQAIDSCSFEIDGVNETGTVSGDTFSCSYAMPFTISYPSSVRKTGHNYSVIPFDVISAIEYQGDLRNVQYWGCGVVNQSIKLKTNVSFYDPSNWCFQLNANGITLDGNGFTVISDASWQSSPIMTDWLDGTVIKNLKVKNFYGGISCGDTCSNILFENNTVLNTSLTALYFGATDTGTIRNNYVDGFGLAGMSFGNTYNYRLTIQNNVIKNGEPNAYGLLTNFGVGDSFTYTGNNITNTTYGITLYLGATITNNAITNNRITNVYDGIDLVGSSNVALTNNVITNATNFGAYIRTTNNITLSGNSYINSLYSLYVDSTDGQQKITETADMFNSTKVSITDIAEAGEIYMINPLSALPEIPPSDYSAINSKFMTFDVQAGSPVLDQLTLYWGEQEQYLYNESTFEMWGYDTGSWGFLGNQTNILYNTIRAFNITDTDPADGNHIVVLGKVNEQPIPSLLSGMSITNVSSGLTNLVKMHIYANSNESNITQCSVRSRNMIDEDVYYWSEDTNTYTVDKDIVFSKTDGNKVYLTCITQFNNYGETGYVMVQSLNIMDNWQILGVFLVSMICLYGAFVRRSAILLIGSAVAYMLFNHLFEGAFFNNVVEYATAMTILKIAFAFVITLITFDLFFKKDVLPKISNP
jgi:parallel beta-helix repeat protein